MSNFMNFFKEAMNPPKAPDTSGMDVNQLMSYFRQPNANDKLMAISKALSGMGDARSRGGDFGQQMGAGGGAMGQSLSNAREGRMGDYEQSMMLQKLMSPKQGKRREAWGVDAQGNPVKYHENVFDDGRIEKVQGSEVPMHKPTDPESANMNLMLKRLLINDKMKPDPVNAPAGWMPDPKNPSAAVVPIVGYAPPISLKSPTEGQAKAEAFGSEMDAAEKDLDAALLEMGGGVIPATRPSSATSIASATPVVGALLGNLAGSPAEQKYKNAMRRIVTAKLRADSGATITQDEIDEQLDQAMPKVTDSDALVEQKRNAIKSMIMSVKLRSKDRPDTQDMQTTPTPTKRYQVIP